MMRDDMALPAVQRDALIAALRRIYGRSSMDADRALAAIEEQYVLIPKDQVTVEKEAWGGVDATRITTPWKEHDDPTR